MRIVKPSVELWNNKNSIDHIVRCAKVCYARDKLNVDNDAFINNLILKNHLSMFRHDTLYYCINIVTDKNNNLIIDNYIKTELSIIKNNPYFTYVDVIYPDNHYIQKYISTNAHYMREHEYEYNIFKCHSISFEDIYKKSLDYKEIKECIRYTFCVITQISTSRELNRVSPNNIAEQSTRYVNFGRKDNEITICEPYWFEYLNKFDTTKAICNLEAAEASYLTRLEEGWSPQNAREFLPLCTATKCVYTYSLKEWRHILDLRYYGITGEPHPNAKIIAKEIRHLLIKEDNDFRD